MPSLERRDGESTAVLEWGLVEPQLRSLERPARAGRSLLPWVLAVLGLVVAVALGIHAYGAYSTIARVNVAARIDTPNPVALLQDIATNGPRVGATVESSSRAIYTRALEQYVLDGTGIVIAVAVLLAGLFARANQH